MAPTTVADLLAALPPALLTLEVKDSLPITTSIVQEPGTMVGRLFYQAIQASFNQDVTTLVALREHAIAMPHTASELLSQTLAVALDQLLQVDGDYTLAVGQSLQTSVPVAGLPLLVGSLSASWVGLAGMPWRYRHAVMFPSPNLQAWLANRWQLTAPTATITQWSQQLWQAWIGQDLSSTVMLSPLTVQSLESRVSGGSNLSK